MRLNILTCKKDPNRYIFNLNLKKNISDKMCIRSLSLKIYNLLTLQIIKIESLNRFNFNELIVDFYIISFVLQQNAMKNI